VPVLARAMVLAGESLFLAGPPDPFATKNPTAALEGKKGGLLVTVAPDTGKTISSHSLASPPVFDGMAAAGGRLYLATQGGQVICMDSK